MNSIKKLLNVSAREIEGQWNLVGNGNQANSPAVIVYIGEAAKDAAEYIHESFKSNWRNSEYIAEIFISDSGRARIDENPELEHEAFEGGVRETVDYCVRNRLLKTTNIFNDMKTVCLECVASGDSPNAGKILDELLELNIGLVGVKIWRTLYLMVSQTEERKQEAAKQLLSYIDSKRESYIGEGKFRQVYVISDFLKSGNILSEDRIVENYNLISDIIMLKNNYNGGDRDPRGVWYEQLNHAGDVRTAAYQMVEKPCMEIVAAVYTSLLKELLECHVREDIELSFNTSSFTFFEDYLNSNLQIGLPRENEMRYLAWVDGVRGGSAFSDEYLNQATGNQWSEFYKANYCTKLDECLESGSFRKELYNYLKKMFNFREMIASFKREDAYNAVLENGARFAGGSDIYIAAAEFGRAKLRATYMERAKAIYRSVLDELYDVAVRFENIIVRIKNSMPRAAVNLSSQLYRTVGDFYEQQVTKWVRSSDNNKRELMSLLDVDMDEQMILERLHKLFIKMINNVGIYKLDFENELSARLAGVGDNYALRTKMIDDALNNNIDESTRLNIAYQPDCRRICQIYLGNPAAEFVKRLMQNSSNSVYNLERSDRVENVIVYNIEQIKSIF